MRIEFEQMGPTEVSVIGIDDSGNRRVIGQIFTPSGTGQDCRNAIQICGFREAFDLWGCGRIMQPKIKFDAEYVYDKNGKKVFEYAKDIQLMFDDEATGDMSHGEWAKHCTGCFNEPCTCERKDKYDNPYIVKREQDLKLLEKDGNIQRTKIRMIGELEDKK